MAVLLLGLCATSCAGSADRPDQRSSPVASPTSAATTERLSGDELRLELLDLKDADQAERTGLSAENNDAARAARLAEIIDDYGWPTSDLVGADGASAAWLIAQHADFDVPFQQRVLDLMTTAVDADAADPTELALLDDRVAVNTGLPQTYGSQIRCVDGAPQPATPIEQPDAVDQRRAGVGLEPLADYYAQFDCSAG